MIKLHPDFQEFLQLLNEYKVQYLVVGGYAVALYGYIRFTSDIDIWVYSTKSNSKKIVKALEAFGIPNAKELGDIFTKDKRVLGMGMPPYKIEVITSIDGVTFRKCYKNKNIVTVEGIEIPFLSLQDLKINKSASGRYKDLNDLENLG